MLSGIDFENTAMPVFLSRYIECRAV